MRPGLQRIRGPAPAPAPRWVIVAFWVIVAAAVGLRLYFMYVQRPALLGFSDSSVYLEEATGSVFWDPLRAVGYGMFLHVLREISPNLSVATVVQHALGVSAVVLL